jgi:hypothetical protein
MENRDKNRGMKTYFEMDHIEHKPLDLRVILHEKCEKLFIDIYNNDPKGCSSCSELFQIIRDKLNINDKQNHRLIKYQQIINNKKGYSPANSGNINFGNEMMNDSNNLAYQNYNHGSSSVYNPLQNTYTQSYIPNSYNQGYQESNISGFPQTYPDFNQTSPQNMYEQNYGNQCVISPSSVDQIIMPGQYFNNSSGMNPSSVNQAIPQNYPQSSQPNPAIRYPKQPENPGWPSNFLQANQYNPGFQQISSYQGYVTQNANYNKNYLEPQSGYSNMNTGISPLTNQFPYNHAVPVVNSMPSQVAPALNQNFQHFPIPQVIFIQASPANRNLNPINPIPLNQMNIPYQGVPSPSPQPNLSQVSNLVGKIPLPISQQKPILISPAIQPKPNLSSISEHQKSKSSEEFIGNNPRHSTYNAIRVTKNKEINLVKDQSQPNPISSLYQTANQPNPSNSGNLKDQSGRNISQETKTNENQKPSESKCKVSNVANDLHTLNRRNQLKQCEYHNDSIILLNCRHSICKKGVEEMMIVKLYNICSLITQKKVEELNRLQFSIGCISDCFCKNLFSFDEFFTSAYQVFVQYSIHRNLWFCIGFLFDGGRLEFNLCKCGCDSVTLGGFGCYKQV